MSLRRGVVVVEDMEYKMMNLQEIEKSTLRLKKGVLPHKFECEKDNQLQLPPVRKDFLKRKYLEIIEGAPCALPAEQSVSSSESNLEAATSLSSSHIHIEKEKNLHINKAIQVNSKIYKRSKSVNVNLCAKTKNAGVSPISIPSKMTSTSPLKIAQPPGIKIKLFEDNTDVASKSSDQPSQLSFSSFEPDDTGSETSWIEDDSERESQFKNQMRSCMLTAIENEPKMLIAAVSRRRVRELSMTWREDPAERSQGAQARGAEAGVMARFRQQPGTTLLARHGVAIGEVGGHWGETPKNIRIILDIQTIRLLD
ncbi:unnamed protein product [Plutella xylostella]|uniref:(diamondback moth) hypothetical protein n=1 Tax=Plutella xylostella TaxID=51655 RepID=A0A8S4DPB1_PLUXY|nr:unnamed protein product [Plutella xylostella]